MQDSACMTQGVMIVQCVDMARVRYVSWRRNVYTRGGVYGVLVAPRRQSRIQRCQQPTLIR